MFKNRAADGRNNIAGRRIAALRKERKLSQRELADQLQLLEVDLSKNAIQQVESGERFVTDLELKGFARFFRVTADELLK